MTFHRARRLAPALLAVALLGAAAAAHDDEPKLPPGFLDAQVPHTFNQPVSVVVAPTGLVYVVEKSGRVRIVEDDVVTGTLLDIRQEVGDWENNGLTAMALDPDFLVNGYLYLFYAVDRHHLLSFGTPQYDPGASELYDASISRITRYTANAADGFRSIDPASRLVLVGETADSGMPLTGEHGAGALHFGEDGSLLASIGDSARPFGPNVGGAGFSAQALADGIIRPEEDVGAWRAQLPGSLAGKILRLDPATGDGLPGNPWYDPAEPRSGRSRVWALGLRNPFRFTVVPGSAASVDDPGVLLIADVGAGDWEELNVCTAPGTNFGWPRFEGLDVSAEFDANPKPNLLAPNPLFGAVQPGSPPCGQQYLRFDDLIVQDSLNPPWWGNPCDPSLPILGVERFVHARPAIAWPHDAGAALVGTYDGAGLATHVALGEPGCPVAGEPFFGNCSIAGAWIPATSSFPAEYRETLLHGDFVEGWIRSFRFDGSWQLVEVLEFGDLLGQLVELVSPPSDGRLWFTDIAGSVHVVEYYPDDVPPDAVASAAPLSGPSPLAVQLDGSGSSDPEGLPLAMRWDFGDGTPPSAATSPRHVFPSVNIAPLGQPIAHVLDELVPPQPDGLDPPFDPAVLHDGTFPPVDRVDIGLMYSTLYWGADEKAALDWFGLEFPQTRRFTGLQYQEGVLLPQSGGWFDTLDVQVRNGNSWTSVTGLVVDPPYTGDDDVQFETYDLDFDPVLGDAIRVIGVPGGPERYVNVAELAVLADPLVPAPEPARFDVTLTVTDPVSFEDVTRLEVFTDDTAPDVTIVEPLNGGSYPDEALVEVPLSAIIADAEHGPGELSCRWQILLHHENHVHPEPFDTSCATVATLVPHGLEGERHWYEFILEVSDPLGMVGSDSVLLLPQSDCNLNGIHDALDIAVGASLDEDLDGVPDECQGDCDGDGINDAAQVSLGAADSDHDLRPDDCETCQTDLGFGAGLEFAVCGDPLTADGNLASFYLGGVAPGAITQMLIGLGAAPVPFKTGTLVPAPIVVISDPLNVPPGGVLAFDMPGFTGTPVTVVIQIVSRAGTSWSFSNALELTIGVP